MYESYMEHISPNLRGDRISCGL